MHADEVVVTERLVSELLRAQLPHLADLPLRVVEPWGTDHAVWRLGDDLSVRLPRIGWAVDQVAFEAEWLPVLGPRLPVEVPSVVAVGEPTDAHPYAWAVHGWIDGQVAGPSTIGDAVAFADDLSELVAALWSCPTDGVPAAGGRARPPAAYDDETRAAIERASALIDAGAAIAVWEEALAAPPHPGPPVWIHGDLIGNCIVRDGRLVGLIDWGPSGVGDPAADVQVVWTPLLGEGSGDRFLDALQVDDATLARSHGAALHQAVSALPYYLDTHPPIIERARHQLAALGVSTRLG